LLPLSVRQLAAVARNPATRRRAATHRREPGLGATAASCLGKAAASRTHSKVAARRRKGPGEVAALVGDKWAGGEQVKVNYLPIY
jgi:hypothetical protein